jgi:hypothetical protein
VSFELIISRDAVSELRRLELWLQEEVLDEMEELAEDPPQWSGVRFYRMIRLRGDDVETTYLHLFIDAAHRTITLLGADTEPPSQGNTL